jgi:hypothetical protein
MLTGAFKYEICEIRSFSAPPTGVQIVMRAIFLLLGEDEDTTTVRNGIYLT